MIFDTLIRIYGRRGRVFALERYRISGAMQGTDIVKEEAESPVEKIALKFKKCFDKYDIDI